MANSASSPAKRSTTISLPRLSSAAASPKVAIVMELPKTSCSQRTLAGGEILSAVETRRMSWLSRGRNMSRCSLKRTGVR